MFTGCDLSTHHRKSVIFSFFRLSQGFLLQSFHLISAQYPDTQTYKVLPADPEVLE